MTQHGHPILADGVNVAPAAPPSPPVADRTRRLQMWVILALSAVVVTATVATRPRDVRGVYPDRLWSDKAHWHAVADVVLAGDSRTAIGLSPAEMAAHLEGVRIRNFGFEAVDFSPQYLKAVEEVLDPASLHKMIVLGVTPLSLTGSAKVKNGFAANLAVPKAGLPGRLLDHLQWHLRRMDTADLHGFFLHRTNSYAEYHEDGWVARWQVRDSLQGTLDGYRKLFDGNLVDAEIRDGVLRQVGEWTRRGIRVYGFRPPTCREMVDLETAISGFDETAFVRRVRGRRRHLVEGRSVRLSHL